MTALVRVVQALISRLGAGPVRALTSGGRAAVVQGRAGHWVAAASTNPIVRAITSNSVLARLLRAAGLLTAAELFIPDLINPTALVPGGGGSVSHPSPVVKEWTANGTPFVRMQNGMLGARKKDGVWTYWRPKKPIVIYASGATSLKNLLRADNAADKQLKRLEKAIRRRNPRQRSTPAKKEPQPVVIVERGSGDVIAPQRGSGR